MKVVDKRRETDEWHAGDVICYWDNPSEKHYGLKYLKEHENE